jgi:para-nitrobenzyl esterase
MFHGAIVESGTYALTQQSLTEAETDGATYATAVGCADQTAACLRSLPVEAVVAHQKERYEPNIDGTTLTQSLGPAFASGQFARVPVINGVNHDEWRLFVALDELRGNPVTEANYQAMISSTLGVPATAAAVIAARYPLSAYPSPAIALGALGTDAIFACNAVTVQQSLSKFVPTFGYEFNDENAPQVLLPPVSFPYGAAHASELQYLFTGPTSLLNPVQERLAAEMQRYWTSFATLGVPLSFNTPLWPRFDGQAQRIQSLNTPAPTVERDFATSHQCAFWALAGQPRALVQM